MSTQLEIETITIFSLIQKLAKNEVIHLRRDESIKISELDMSDFMTLASTEDHYQKLNLIQKLFSHHGLFLNFEGSIQVGNLNLDDRSWVLGAGDSGELKISARSLPLKKSVDELVQFLKKLELGQGLILKAGQDLLIEGLHTAAVQNYYELSKNAQDPKVIEKIQDEFFVANSKLLKDEGLLLKVFALDATAVNREVNPELGFVIYRAQSTDSSKTPRLVMALTKKA